jgi:hypothetical protein
MTSLGEKLMNHSVRIGHSGRYSSSQMYCELSARGELRRGKGVSPRIFTCPRQVTWRLHSFVVNLARLGTAWFMQRDGKAGIHHSNNMLLGRVRCIVYRTLLMLVLGTERAESDISPNCKKQS